MLFIVSLITTVSAAYLYEKFEKTRAEVAIACVPVALISLVLMLVVAPWQLQLVLTLTALLSYRVTKNRLFN